MSTLLFPIYFISSIFFLITDLYSGKILLGFLLFMGQFLSSLSGMLLKFGVAKALQNDCGDNISSTIEIIHSKPIDLLKILISMIVMVGVAYWLVSLSIAFPLVIFVVLIGFVCGYMFV